MPTSVSKATDTVRATSVRFDANRLVFVLSDGREIGLPLDRVEWLAWLANATEEQRANWTVEPGGCAVYWNDLDDGVEICHVLGMQPVA